MTESLDRWMQIKKTTPSGKTLFVCQSCGQQTPAPTEECPAMVKVQHGGDTYVMPCSAWPRNPVEYVQQRTAASGMDAYFSGLVILPDNSTIEVSVPVPEETARQIAILSVEYDLVGAKRDERKRKETRELEIMKNEAVKDMTQEERRLLQSLQEKALAERERTKGARFGNNPNPIAAQQSGLGASGGAIGGNLGGQVMGARSPQVFFPVNNQPLLPLTPQGAVPPERTAAAADEYLKQRKLGGQY